MSDKTKLASIVSDCIDKAYLEEVKAGNVKGATSFAPIARSIKACVTKKFTELGLEDHRAILAATSPKKNGPSDKASTSADTATADGETKVSNTNNDNDESALDESVLEPHDWFVQQFNRNANPLPSPKYKWCQICNRWLSKLTEHRQAHHRHKHEDGAVVCPLPAVEAFRTVCLEQYPDQTALRSHINRDHRIKNERMKPGVPVNSPLGQLMLRAEERGVNQQDSNQPDGKPTEAKKTDPKQHG
ncbi:unnamed protein product [Sordaria macrospora k-hell]|uniref:WGS project CABT00000000 data, contig 2.4 n=2 Tax=Sordaria macrospora TaxID=5147 RepID=F7VR37_SORMK|nr:uncharacterized protein SMAC_01534 [Sordaria macrospora k-hell]CCC07970.1 unnamed protein product [Sordaria macrospora k-hell]